MSAEITGINKIQTVGGYDTFEYRDMYNDVQTITFPTIWGMSDQDVENWLTMTPKDYVKHSKKSKE